VEEGRGGPATLAIAVHLLCRRPQDSVEVRGGAEGNWPLDNEADDGTNRLPIYNYYFKNSYIPLMLKHSITTSLTVEQ
jgi:hypothetical protein